MGFKSVRWQPLTNNLCIEDETYHSEVLKAPPLTRPLVIGAGVEKEKMMLKLVQEDAMELIPKSRHSKAEKQVGGAESDSDDSEVVYETTPM